MITQILGVALISLLTITPTIQNKLNIEIEPMVIINPSYSNQVLNIVDYEIYIFTALSSQDNPYRIIDLETDQLRGAQILINPIVSGWADTDLASNLDNGVIIENDNFYIYSAGEAQITGNGMRNIINSYYTFSRGTTPTSTTVSFTATTGSIAETTTYYTYTVSNSTTGSMSGRVYYQSVGQHNSNSGSTTNNNITVPQGTTLQNVIDSILPTATLENPSLATSNNKIILHWFNEPIPLDTIGTYTRTLYSRTNYLRMVEHGTVTINVTSNDTTPPVITGPTSITFEVGTYSLIEQILNTLYTFTDNVGIEDAYYFPVTSINTVGTFNITIYATDAAGNQTNLPVTITTTAPPPNDTTPPVIIGSDTITRNLGQVNNDAQLANQFNITDDYTQQSAIVKTITGTRSYTQAGTYNLTLTATDIAGNVATKQFTFIINPPVIDNEPPVIVSDLIVSITIGDFTDRQEILDFYTTVTDNVALSTVLLVGDINFNVVGDYQLQIIATDTSQNQSTRNILVRIKDEVILGNYNPLTDLLSGIFGAALSMVFTIGTVNVLGLRLLDAMGVIILGAVLLFIYKAIKGGS
jgi:hypothetical protein